MSEGQEDKPSGQQISFEKQIGGVSSNLPRTARARTGLTTDPLPPGKKVAEPELHGELKPAGHDQDRAHGGAPGDGSREDFKAKADELKQIGGAAKYDSAANVPVKHQDPVKGLSNKTQREGKY